MYIHLSIQGKSNTYLLLERGSFLKLADIKTKKMAKK